MMQDKLDEIRKMLAISEADKQQPANGIPEQRIEKRRTIEDYGNLGDIAVAATPELLNIFGGGTMAEKASRTAQGSKYLQNRALADQISKKDLVEIENELGSPEYIQAKYASGMKPYSPIKSGGSASKTKAFDTGVIYDMDTGEYTQGSFDRTTNKYYEGDQETTLGPRRIFKPVAEKLIKMKDIGGGETASLVSQYGKKTPTQVAKEPGLASAYGVKTEGQAKAIEKGIEKGAEEYQDLTGKLLSVDDQLDTLKNSKDERQIAAAIYETARAVEPKGVFTDQDFKMIAGDYYRPWVENLKTTLATKGLGEIKNIRDSFIPLAEKIKREMSKKIKSIPGRYAPGTKEGQSAIESVVPKKVTKKMEADLISIKNQAKKFFGNNKEAYEGFINKKKKELGYNDER